MPDGMLFQGAQGIFYISKVQGRVLSCCMHTGIWTAELKMA